MENLETKLEGFEDFKKRLAILYKGTDIFLNDGRLYASLHIPEFALQGFDGNFYAFNSCTITVPLVVRDCKVIDWESPVVWEDYSHPLLLHLRKAQQHLSIPISGADFKRRVVEFCQRAHGDYTSVEHQVALVLHESIELLLIGYSGNRDKASILACYHLDTETFREEHQRYLSNPTFYRRRITNRIVS